jgi:hypothetical protein
MRKRGRFEGQILYTVRFAFSFHDLPEAIPCCFRRKQTRQSSSPVSSVDTFHDEMLSSPHDRRVRQGSLRQVHRRFVSSRTQRMNTFSSNLRHRNMRRPPLLQRAKSLPLVLCSEAAASKPLFWFRPLPADRCGGRQAWASSPSYVKSTNWVRATNLQRDDAEGLEDELAGLTLLEADDAW